MVRLGRGPHGQALENPVGLAFLHRAPVVLAGVEANLEAVPPMTFWTVFAAALLAQVIGGILGVTIDFVAGFVKNRRKRRAIERDLRAELADIPGQMAEYVTAPQPALLGGLKPCPFCGHAEVQLARRDPRPGGPLHTEFAVFCDSCGTAGPALRQPERAEDAWNGAPRAAERF